MNKKYTKFSEYKGLIALCNQFIRDLELYAYDTMTIDEFISFINKLNYKETFQDLQITQTDVGSEHEEEISKFYDTSIIVDNEKPEEATEILILNDSHIALYFINETSTLEDMLKFFKNYKLQMKLSSLLLDWADKDAYSQAKNKLLLAQSKYKIKDTRFIEHLIIANEMDYALSEKYNIGCCIYVKDFTEVYLKGDASASLYPEDKNSAKFKPHLINENVSDIMMGIIMSNKLMTELK